MKPKIYFVMPAYNEEANIEDVVNQWYPVVERCGSECRLVIANDGSKDCTFEKMLALTKDRPQFIPLDKPNSGHGATLLYLYRYAIDAGASHVFQTDSDGQTLPEEFEPFFDDIENYDLQIGHRNARKDGFSRVVVTQVLRTVIYLIFGEKVKDANTPYRLMSVQALKEILEIVPKDFFLSNVAISVIATRWKKKMKWRPITFRPRQGGVNSINLKRITKIGIKALSDFRQINDNLRRHGTK